MTKKHLSSLVLNERARQVSDKEPEFDEDEPQSQISLDEELLNIDLFGPMSYRVTMLFKAYLDKLIRTYKGLPQAPKEPITVVINSRGGDATQGLAIYDLIRTCGVKIRTITLGEADSAAMVIFLAGHERLIHKNAHLLFHRTDGEPGNSRRVCESFINQLITLDKRYNKIVLDNSKLTRAQLNRLGRLEKFITAEEAVKFGLAHGIIE